MAEHGHPMAFRSLPNELLQIIALHLESDKDLISFALVCPEAHAAIQGDWRSRFLRFFDPVFTDSLVTFKTEYQKRQKLLRSRVHFTTGRTPHESRCLKLLRTLITESCGKAQGDEDVIDGRNFDRIRAFVQRTNVLKDRHKVAKCPAAKGEPLHYALRLILLPMALDLNHPIIEAMFPFQDAQKAAYSYIEPSPLLQGRRKDLVNLEYLVKMADYWKTHITRSQEFTLYHYFADLEELERPQMWEGRLQDVPPFMGKHWLGTYSSLAHNLDFDKINLTPTGSHVFEENVDCEGEGFQCSQEAPSQEPGGFLARLLDGIEDAMKLIMYDRFAGSSYSRFVGCGFNLSHFHVAGRIYNLPPQQGIVGWQRVIMLKHFEHNADPLVGASHDVYVYEGCIIPGGQMMLGRWWILDPDEPTNAFNSGPFMFWRPRPAAEGNSTCATSELGTSDWASE
ncbi:MAG: hypothetical protein M1817_001586 [Caeruleum heppii]|nr:MAG: hypothetical protein M1817_001586 [Caeruleum heppii]